MTAETRRKRILAKVYACKFLKGPDPASFLESSLQTDQHHLLSELKELEKDDCVFLNSDLPSLTKKGRSQLTVVMAGGSFDIIHPGHIETLEKARALGDCLVVSVARDATFERNKKRKPLHDETLRQKLVSSLRVVDLAVLGSEVDIFDTVLLLKPDIIALGYDQSHNESSIQAEMGRRSLNVRIVRLQSSIPNIKTTAILNDKDGLSS